MVPTGGWSLTVVAVEKTGSASCVETVDRKKWVQVSLGSLDTLKFRDGQVNGGWWLGSMATARPGTPDALDGWAEEKVRRQWSQDMVEKYEWSHFIARHDANLL